MPSSPPVAVVTGAAAGIGRAIAQALADAGYALALIDLADPGTVAGDAGLAFVGDVSDAAVVGRFAAAVGERFGRVDVLVNNAGISSIGPAEELPLEVWRRVLDVNLTAPFALAQAFGRTMLQAGAGSIVNVASIAGLRGVSDRAAYNASKHGLIGLTRTLAAEWGGRGVRVNAVCPGWVKTPMDDADQAAGGYDDADIEQQVPMGRFAAPQDIAAAVRFLADPVAAAFVNGVALPVDGGWIADASWTTLRMRKR
jgi:NAD(P)-dependent dehydrogenase (short-subunit alcohol dehydrogenase family)